MIEPTRPSPDVDALARRLRRRELTPERAQVLRGALVDAAGASPSRWSRRPVRGWLIGAAAATALVVGFLVLRHDERAAAPGASPATSPVASSDRSADRTLVTGAEVSTSRELSDGITAVEAKRPVQMTRGKDMITAPAGARFTVAVQDGHVRMVTVTQGWVVIASSQAATTIVAERQTWTLPAPAASSAAPASSPPAATQQPGQSTSPPAASASPGSPPASGPRGSPAANASLDSSASTSTRRESAVPVIHSEPRPAADERTAAPGVPHAPAAERDFHDGLRALLMGHPRNAVDPLARACTVSSSSQADICFWAAVAQLRAGDRARARSAFTDVANPWPGATHIGETNVALGWLLLEAGDRAAARVRFAAAAHDPLPDVRNEALRGLTATQ
jgi:hypothetical protein